MYDKGKIITGIVVFLLLVLFPVWYSALAGRTGHVPDPVISKSAGDRCVEPAEYMRSSHMDLLDAWRDDYVRHGGRAHVAPDGTRYEKSLVNTCLRCHDNKSEFCDRCHDYLGAKPICWDCHVVVERGR